jgi:hypothetical protein
LGLPLDLRIWNNLQNEALKFLDQSGLRGVIACLRPTD